MGKYSLSYQWEVVTPAPAITLEPLGNLNPVNVGTESEPIEAHVVRVRWRDNSVAGSRFGELSFQIDAMGRGVPH